MTDSAGVELVAGDDGVLRPMTVTPEHLLSAEELSLHRSVNSGGSGRGGSFWAVASRCGRKALLQEAKYSHFREVESTLPILKNHFLVGSLYHKMQEMWRGYKRDSLELWSLPYVNVNVQEAARLFQGYVANWTHDLWGNHLAIEEQMPDSPEAAKEVKEIFGVELTGRVDMVVDLQGEHLAMARERLPELIPGRYIVDFKTAEMPGNGIGYTMGLQSMVYPFLWNLENPGRQVQGTIFDVIYKRSRRRAAPLTRDDFGAYLAPFDDADMDRCIAQLRGMMRQGAYTTENDIPNRSECCSWRGETCQFYNKECNAEV